MREGGPPGPRGCDWNGAWAPACAAEVPGRGGVPWPVGSAGILSPRQWHPWTVLSIPTWRRWGSGLPVFPGGQPRRWSNTCRRRSLGTKGRNVPVAVSPMRSRSPTLCVTICKPVLERSACTWGQRIRQRGHVSEVEKDSVSDGYAGRGGSVGGDAGDRRKVHPPRCTWCHKVACVLRYKCQVALSAAIPWWGPKSGVCGQSIAGNVCPRGGSGSVWFLKRRRAALFWRWSNWPLFLTVFCL